MFIKPPKLPCQPLTFDTLPSKPLLGYVTTLPSPLIALLVAGEVEDFSMVDRVYVGISQYLFYIINASIYLVKGGRLGLLPGVLFHSCRPSFRHTGVMFPDFAFLMRLGYYGNPLTVRLE